MIKHHVRQAVLLICGILHFCHSNLNVCRCNTAERWQCVDSVDWSQNQVMASFGEGPRRRSSTPFPRRGETSSFAVCSNGRVGRLLSVQWYWKRSRGLPAALSGRAVIRWCFALTSTDSVVADPLNLLHSFHSYGFGRFNCLQCLHFTLCVIKSQIWHTVHQWKRLGWGFGAEIFCCQMEKIGNSLRPLLPIFSKYSVVKALMSAPPNYFVGEDNHSVLLSLRPCYWFLTYWTHCLMTLMK